MADKKLISEIQSHLADYFNNPNQESEEALKDIFLVHPSDLDVDEYARGFMMYRDVIKSQRRINEVAHAVSLNIVKLLVK